MLRDGHENAAFRCFLAAQRVALFGLTGEELSHRRDALRQEAGKIDTAWRKEAIGRLLEPKKAAIGWWMKCRGKQLSAHTLYEATLLRDEYFHNRYFKQSLLQSQLTLLSVLMAVAFVLFLALLLIPTPPWLAGPVLANSNDTRALDAKTLLLVALIGIVGAAFSAMVSTAKVEPKGPIPEHLSQRTLTIARAALGAPAAVVAALVLRTTFWQVGNVDASDIFVMLVVAFAAGFSERLVVRAVESVSGNS
jgi:hypothetical protein